MDWARKVVQVPTSSKTPESRLQVYSGELAGEMGAWSWDLCFYSYFFGGGKIRVKTGVKGVRQLGYKFKEVLTVRAM